MLLALKDNNFGRLISVDIKTRNRILDDEFEDLKPYCTFVRGSSYDEKTLELVKKELNGEKCDMLLLDGDHKLPGVQYDVDNYFPMVNSGGIALMHDICNRNEDVKEVWRG